MELKQIKQLLKENKKIVFGYPDNRGNLALMQIWVDVKAKTITFTTDTPDCLIAGKLEKALEKLFAEFGVIKYQIQIHIHKGKLHDKNITLQLEEIENIQDPEEMPEIVKFIQDNFYKTENWVYEVKCLRRK